MDNNTKLRLYEIAFLTITNRLQDTVGKDKVNYFLEHFCYAFNIDYTSISILLGMYAQRMKPTKRELAMYTFFVNMPFKHIPVDYRTIRKYKLEWETDGMPPMHPRIVNAFMQPTIKQFVDTYVHLMFDDLQYIVHLRGATEEALPNEQI